VVDLLVVAEDLVVVVVSADDVDSLDGEGVDVDVAGVCG
jgi:hypothetical protein